MQSSEIPEAFYAPETRYSPPEASLENNEPQPGHSLSPRALAHLAASRKWMLAVGVMLGMAGLVKVVMILAVANIWWGISPAMTAMLILTAAGIVFIFAVPLPQLFRSGRAISKARESGCDSEILKAIQAHRRFWTRLVFGFLVGLVLWVLGVMVMFIMRKV